jgi:hypothetical protein
LLNKRDLNLKFKKALYAERVNTRNEHKFKLSLKRAVYTRLPSLHLLLTLCMALLLRINLCSTLGTSTAGVIAVATKAIQSVAWSDLNETVTGVECARSRASLPILTGKRLQNITLVGSISYRPWTLLNFQEPVPAEAYYRQSLDYQQWDDGYGDRGTITYGGYRPSIRFSKAESYFDLEWRSCRPLILEGWGLRDPPVALSMVEDGSISTPIVPFPASTGRITTTRRSIVALASSSPSGITSEYLEPVSGRQSDYQQFPAA